LMGDSMLRLSHAPDEMLTILCLGAHSDDIEIGCGGTILRLIGEYNYVHVVWIVCSAIGQRANEARQSAGFFLGSADDKTVIVKDYRDGFFPYIGAEIKEYFELLKQDCSPDIIFTHYRHDRHQDHRVISDLTWNTFRSHLILEYEIPKYDGDLGSPNLFVGLDESVCRSKVEYLLDAFRTQAGKQWFSADTFLAILRLRGIESPTPTTYAEAFYCRKLAL
jgi:LmbE family N-acetylglucosaminyl deacetylase